MRYRLIPARPMIACTLYVEHDTDEAALAQATKLAAERKDRILVCRVRENGLVQEVGLVGQAPEESKKRGRS